MKQSQYNRKKLTEKKNMCKYRVELG